MYFAFLSIPFHGSFVYANSRLFMCLVLVHAVTLEPPAFPFSATMYGLKYRRNGYRSASCMSHILCGFNFLLILCISTINTAN